MIKTLFVFLLSLFSINAFAGYGGYIGTYDNRRYGSLADPEYNGVAKLTSSRGMRGSGVFVSKNILLTNNHCVAACKNGCTAEFWNGSEYETANLKILAYNEKSEAFNGTDWGLLLADKDSNFYKPIAPRSSTGPVLRGGYGILRVIEDDEIPFLKDLYAKTMNEYKEECDKSPNKIECFNKQIDKQLEKLGKKPLFKDGDNFKVQNCNIVGNTQNSNKMMQTDCDSSGGDSGAPVLRNGQIVGLNNGGLQAIFGANKINAVVTKTENFYLPVQNFISESQYTKITDSWHKYIDDKDDKETLGPIKLDSAPVTSDAESDVIQQMLKDLDCD